MFIQFSSIKRSLLLIVLVVTGLALVIAFTISTYSQIQHYRASLIERSVAYAKVTAFNALSSVVFDDNETESQRLRSLRSTSFVRHVHIYQVDEITGDLTFFASYNRRGFAPIPAKFSVIDQLSEPRIQDNYLEIAEPIRLDNDIVGYVYLRASMSELNDFIQRTLMLAGIVTIATLLLATLLSMKMRRTITKPLDSMVEVIQQVAREKDYSLRLPSSQLQEVDSISHAFNTMLNRIQQHINRQEKAEREASQLTSELERQVSQRTMALKEANKELLTTLEQLHQYQSQLVESEKMASLGDMVAGIAHEVNTPIGLSVTASTLLQDKLQVMQQKFTEGRISTHEFERFLNDCDENLAIIYRNVNRAADLITSFKQVAVDQSSEVDRTIHVPQFMSDVLLSIRARLRDAEKFKIKIDCDPDLTIETKPGPLNQILINLITNSMLHGFEGRDHGVVNIRFSMVGTRELEVIYQDDGVGVPVDIRRRIFDPFVTSKRGSGGSGLGMHLVYNLVTQVLQGQIHFFSEQSHGVEFALRFPVKQMTRETTPEGIDMTNAPLPKWFQHTSACVSLVLVISVTLLSHPVQAQSSAPDTTRAQFLRQMLHFLKWNAATMREAPPTYCFMTHANDTSEEYQDGVLTIMRQRHPGAEESDHRLLSFNTISQLELHLANDVCHILYTPYALVDDIGDTRLAQYSRTTLTISDDIGFLRRGGIASLNYESERVRLYVNPNQLRQSDIDFASRLMQVTRFYPDLE